MTTEVTAAKPRRTWLTRILRVQFSLRTLLVLLLLAGPITYSWLRFIRPYQADRVVAQHVLKFDGTPTWQTQGPAWLVRMAGEKSFQRLVAVRLSNPKLTDEDMRIICKATALQRLTVRKNAGLTDATLEHVSELPELSELSLFSGNITGEGLVHLLSLSDSLTQLHLYGIQVQGEQLLPIASLVKLEELTLSTKTLKPKDPGLRHLAYLPNLQKLTMRNMVLRGLGVRYFQKDRK